MNYEDKIKARFQAADDQVIEKAYEVHRQLLLGLAMIFDGYEFGQLDSIRIDSLNKLLSVAIKEFGTFAINIGSETSRFASNTIWRTIIDNDGDWWKNA